MTDRQPMDHKDWCRLSRVFVSKYNKLDSQDMRINEFLKEMIVEAKEGRADPVAEYARLVLETTLNCHKHCQQRIAELEAANHRLELVGGEWGHADNGSCSWREIGEWTIWLRFGITAVVWNIDKGCETCDREIARGTAPTREDAIAAAEAALLGEIGKFVRVKQ